MTLRLKDSALSQTVTPGDVLWLFPAAVIMSVLLEMCTQDLSLQLLKPNLHFLTCQLPRQCQSMGHTADLLEFWVERAMNLVKQLTKNRASVEPETVVTGSLLLAAACQAVAVTGSSDEATDVLDVDASDHGAQLCQSMIGPCKRMHPASDMAAQYRYDLHNFISAYSSECISAGFTDMKNELEPGNGCTVDIFQRATTAAGEAVASSEYTRTKSRDSRMVLYPGSVGFQVGRIEALLQVQHENKSDSSINLVLIRPFKDSQEHADADLGTMYSAMEPAAGSPCVLMPLSVLKGPLCYTRADKDTKTFVFRQSTYMKMIV